VINGFKFQGSGFGFRVQGLRFGSGFRVNMHNKGDWGSGS
jgi:hypothetical protein